MEMTYAQRTELAEAGVFIEPNSVPILLLTKDKKVGISSKAPVLATTSVAQLFNSALQTHIVLPLQVFQHLYLLAL
jgi:hypothetical protein